MNPRQEFLIVKSDGVVSVYTPRTYPLETPIGRDAQRLGVDGPSLVRPPKIELSEAEFDDWRRHLEDSGFAVTLGPFWRNPVSAEEALEAIRAGEKTWTLEEVRDELLRRAEGRCLEEARRLESAKPPAT